MDLSQVKALGAVINSSIAQLEDIQTTTRSRSETDTKFEYLKPSLQLVAAASQLVALARTPERYLMDLSTGYLLSACLRTVIEAHVVETLREFGKGPNKTLSVQEIGHLTQVNPSKLGRVIRLLATHHVFEEVVPNEFANNVHSLPMDTGKSLSELQANPIEMYDGTNGLAAIMNVYNHTSMYNGFFLADTLKDPNTTNSLDAYDAPFSRSWAQGAHMTMFEWLNLPENLLHRKRYQVAMNGWNRLVPADAMLRGFDFSTLPEGAAILDCGGGIGSATMPIIKAIPHVSLIVQDMEGVVAEAQGFWQSEYPAALAENRVSFQAHNLFDPQPASNSQAAVFVLRMILHGWPDAECLQILKQIRSCIGDNGAARVVLIDNIMHYASREQRAKGQETSPFSEDAFAPEPLLANWGAANALAYKQDINMLANHNACERTLQEFSALLSQTGFRITEVYAAHQSWLPQIIAAPV